MTAADLLCDPQMPRLNQVASSIEWIGFVTCIREMESGLE
jgi:hypothetical protein